MESFFDRALMEAPASETAPPPEGRKPLTADDVRAKMMEIIDALSSADTMPFTDEEIRRHAAMLPIMAKWLSAAEGGAMLASFRAELVRLGSR